MRLILLVAVVIGMGCANPISVNQCHVYAAIAKTLSLAIAEKVDESDDEKKAELREEYAEIAKLVADLGCEVVIPLLEEPEPEEPEE